MIISSIAIIINLFLIVLFYRQSKLFQKLYKQKFEPESHQKEFVSLENKIRDYAKTELLSARVKTDSLIEEILKLTEDLKTKLISDIEEVSKRYLNEEQEILDKYALLMREDILSELKKEKANLTQIVIQKQTQIDQELMDYKNEELAKIKSKSQIILKDLLENYFNEALSSDDQEKLILNSLNKAKKDNVF